MAEITFVRLPAADLKERPITFLGKVDNLSKVQYSDVSPYLAPKVSAEVSSLCTQLALLCGRRRV